MEKVILNNVQLDYLATHDSVLKPRDGNVCEVMDSYALHLATYDTTQPLQAWLKKHWKFVVQNGQSFQSSYSQSCGGYALMYLRDRARGKNMNDYLSQFSKHDYVHNDHKVEQMLKKLIVHELGWHHACKSDHHPCN